MTTSDILILVVRYGLVVLFFPASALDKILNFRGAVKTGLGGVQAALAGGGNDRGRVVGGARHAARHIDGRCGPARRLHHGRLLRGDRASFQAVLGAWRFLAGRGQQGARSLLGFLKNFSLASGFLLITIGLDGQAWREFAVDPFVSSHPYGASAPTP
jgi:putative oxidoreductase